MQQFQQQRQTQQDVLPKLGQPRIRLEPQLQRRNEDAQDEARRREQQRGQERKPF